jgi:hypothetical protein
LLEKKSPSFRIWWTSPLIRQGRSPTNVGKRFSCLPVSRPSTAQREREPSRETTRHTHRRQTTNWSCARANLECEAPGNTGNSRSMLLAIWVVCKLWFSWEEDDNNNALVLKKRSSNIETAHQLWSW